MIDHSRVVRLVTEKTGGSESKERARLEKARVHISVEPTLSGALLTLRVLISTLRRMPGILTLDPSPIDDALTGELVAHAEAIDHERGIHLAVAPHPDAIQLHVGLTAPSVDAIRVVPDGYGAHAARDAGRSIQQMRPAHPLGAVLAASFGAAEVFKDAAEIPEALRTDPAIFSWCPVTLSHDVTAVPMLIDTITVDMALAGCGAIGTALALILSELDAEGLVQPFDQQTFAPENLTTNSLGTESEVTLAPRKVNLIRDVLQPRYRVETRHGDVAELADDVDACRLHWPQLVLAGLDSVEARHHVQRLWPDRLIDVGTSGTVVGLHDVVAQSGPCLMCFLPTGGRESAVTRIAELTGLSVERLGRGDDPLLEDEVAHLSSEQRDLLRSHIGKPVCGLTDILGQVDGVAAYRAAVPFVALQAACLAIGRLIAIELGIVGLPNFVQYDTLIGPHMDIGEHRRAITNCYCQTHAAIIEQVRSARGKVFELDGDST